MLARAAAERVLTEARTIISRPRAFCHAAAAQDWAGGNVPAEDEAAVAFSPAGALTRAAFNIEMAIAADQRELERGKRAAGLAMRALECALVESGKTDFGGVTAYAADPFTTQAEIQTLFYRAQKILRESPRKLAAFDEPAKVMAQRPAGSTAGYAPDRCKALDSAA